MGSPIQPKLDWRTLLLVNVNMVEAAAEAAVDKYFG